MPKRAATASCTDGSASRCWPKSRCAACVTAEGRVTPTVIADHVVPMSQGGRTIRSNYQGLCEPHHRAKTAAEAAHGAALARCR